MPTLTQENSVRASGLIMVVTALMAVGLVMVASASASVDRSLFAGPLLRNPFARQGVFILCGLAAMLLTARVTCVVLASPSARRRCTLVLCVATMACLLAALLPGLGDTHRGSDRWLRFYVGETAIGFQPSEFAKPAMVLLLAWLLAERGVDPRLLKRGFIPAALAIGVFVLLVGKEDFGTAALLAGVGGAMLFVAGCRLRHLAAVAGLGTVGMTLLLYAAPYRLARITAYQDFWADPKGGGYQPLQSLIAIASGGWFGAGLGGGVGKYGYLPESHTDFIFAVICEEMGVFGACLVIALYAAFIWLGLRAMLSAATPFERLVALGLTAVVGLQAVMNIAVVTVVTPTTGISLPLISAGGSGLLMFCLLTGVLMAVAIRGSNSRPGNISPAVVVDRAWSGKANA